VATSALFFATPAMSQGNPPVFNNAPTIALPSICSTETFNFNFALGNVMNHSDGTLDLVMICGQNIVTVEGTGKGTFLTTSPVITSLPSGFAQISQFSLALNVDGGGQLDLVATDFQCMVDVFPPGASPGTFSSNPTRKSEGLSPCNTSTAPATFFVADLNGDGLPDIAVENRSSGAPSIIVLLNTSTPGAVSFGAPNVISLGIPANSSTQQFGGMAVGNFTGHSAPVVADMAVAIGTFVSGAGFTNSVYVLKNNGLGTAFAAQPSVTLPATTNTGTLVGLVAAILSGDGSLDLAAADTGDGAIFVLYGHGTGALTSCSSSGNTTSIASCQSSSGQTITGLPLIFANKLLAGNFNGPGGPPGLLFASANECVSVLLAAAGGGLQTAPTTYVVGNSPTSVVAGDVNNDGYTDAIVAWNNGLSVFLNNTGGTLQGTQAYLAGAAPGGISLLQNFFGDGEQDLAVIPINSGITGGAAAVTVLGAPASGPNGTLPQSFPIYTPVPGQTITAMTSGCILSNPNPCATPFVAFTTFQSASGFNNAYIETSGSGGPSTAAAVAVNFSSQQITAIAAGDFNGDGYTDLAFAIGGTNTILVFTGNGNGTFSTTPTTILLGAGHDPIALAAANFKGSGLPDIAVLNQTTNSVGILLNNTSNGVGATLSFATMASYPTGLSFPVGFTVGDFNGDKKPDIAVVSGQAIAILLNTGSGTFPGTAPTPIPLPPSSSASAIATGDFNGDGILDLAVALPFSSNTVEILNGKGDGTFATTTAPTFWAVGANPAAMVVANFKSNNGDGLPDIAVADGDPEGNTVALLLNGTAAANAPLPPSSTSTNISSTLNPSIFGQSVTFVAGVINTTSSSGAAPTGAVQFVVDGITFGLPVPLTLGTNGGASAATSGATASLSVTGSPHTVAANYLNADGNFINSSGTLPGGQVVSSAGTTTALNSSQNPSTFGQSLTFTATVTNTASGSSAAPTGTVQFVVDGVSFGSPVALTPGTGNIRTATSGATTTLTVAGSPHTVAANYVNSDGNFINSSGALSGGQIVNPAGAPPPPAVVMVMETINVTDSPSLPDLLDTEMITVTDIVKVIACQAINITPTGTLPGATVGVPYTPLPFSVASAVGAVTWATSGNVPPGLSMNPTSGIFSGTPTSTGSPSPVNFNFAVSATPQNGCPPVTVAVSLAVNPAPAGVTLIAIISGNSNDQGIPLPGNVTLVGNSSPFTVTVAVQVPSGDPNATGTFTVVDTNNPQITCTGTLTAGTGTCPLITTGASPGNLTLSATFTPNANSIELLPSTSNPSTVQILQISPCGTLPGPQTSGPGMNITFTATICVAGDVPTTNPTITVAGCPPNATCITSATPVPNVNGVLAGIVTVTVGGTSGKIPPQNSLPRNKPWRVPVFGLGLLSAILMAVQLARQKRARPRLAYAAGILLALLLTGISGCGNGHFPNGIPTPPNTYTLNVTVTAGSNSVTVPLTLTVTQ
jgi:hypothetical protein